MLVSSLLFIASLTPSHAAVVVLPSEPTHGEPDGNGSEHDDGASESHGGAEHGAVHHFLAGAEGVELVATDQGKVSTHEGVGVFAAWVVDPNWLELEVAGKMLTGDHGATMPLLALAKKPFHATAHLHPFVGAGGGMILPVGAADSEEDDTAVHAKAASHEAAASTGEAASAHPVVTAVGGVDYWLSDHVGLVCELEYGLAFAHHTAQEFGGGVGVVLGF